ncbi:hypothetical protein [Treponema putidum]|uniref:hypothetical protein n=1 Tax=Treponema putidum TaxID=221027 RepID=UPI002104687C|nr:hypothetical protein [Treponema putidum]
MAMTIPMLGKSLEDLTRVVKESNGKNSDLLAMIKAKKEAIGFEDFLPEQITPTLKDVTPEELKNLAQTIEAKEENNNAYSIILSNMGIFENGKIYNVSADFKTTSSVIPEYATLECINITKNEVIALTDTPVINGECRCALSLEYNQNVDDEICVLFYAGKKGSTSSVSCEYSHFKIKKLEPFSQEEKEAAQQALDVFLSKTEQYKNVIRNKNGNISVPDSAEESEAVNLKKVKEEIKNKIEELIDNAPDALNTLKELADALTENKDGITAINAALANRYTKQEMDEKFVAKAAFVLTGSTLEITI